MFWWILGGSIQLEYNVMDVTKEDGDLVWLHIMWRGCYFVFNCSVWLYWVAFGELRNNCGVGKFKCWIIISH